MASSPKKDAGSGAKLIATEYLYFDDENPRLVEIDEFKSLAEEEKAEILWRDMAAEEIASSIAENGYFNHEPLFAIKESAKRFTVIEGNRRLAAVKVLLSPKLRKQVKSESLPRLTPSRKEGLLSLPVIVTTREKIWQYIGFKHVNGPRPWGAYSKAEYIARIHNEYKISLEEIARLMGDQRSTVRRLYRGLMALEQAEKEGTFNRSDRSSKRFFFSHLYTGLGSKGVQNFLSITEKTSYKKNPVQKKKLKDLGQLCVWLYGSKSAQLRPLIRSQNPDLNSLSEALLTSRGTDALRAGLPLNVAVDAGKGDERILREAMTGAKEALRTAVGTVSTGYDGKTDLLDLAEEIYSSSGKLLDDMLDHKKYKKRRRGRSSK